ncbi:hypothetical protein ACO0T9_28510, partial [Pseudomonas aeruginosa]
AAASRLNSAENVRRCLLIRHLSHGEDFRLNRCPGSVDHYNGYMESLRFYNEGNWNFAVTANQQWLLFYFRKPCFRLAQYSRDEILQRFEGVVERASGELKFHLRNISDVQRLIDYIEK